MRPDTIGGKALDVFSDYTSGAEKATQKPIKLDSGVSNPFNSYKSQVTDLKSAESLYSLAKTAGLGDEADAMIKRSGGESQKFMSGGFIMDAMDVLNMSSYGMVGLVKGKGFIEGVKNRESLSDEDALGKFGWQGKVAGLIGDIILDPLTYIAPIKLIGKIPGVAKAAKIAKTNLFGELKTIEVGSEAGELNLKTAVDNKILGEQEPILIKGQKTFKREGGWKPLTFLSDKLIYGSAVSKEFLNGVQRIAGKHESMLGDAEKLMTTLSKITPDIFDKTLAVGPDGRMITKSVKELEIGLRREGLDKGVDSVKEIYKLRDDLMKRLVDLGVIKSGTAEAHWGTYLKQSYDEYLEAKKSYSGLKTGIGTDVKKRVEELTPEMMEELGQVKDGSVLWATTLLKQIDLVKKAELQKFTADGYAMTKEMLEEYGKKGGKMEDLHQVTNDAAKYGLLSGKFVSKEVWNALKGSFEPSKELGENLVLGFKHVKVVWNPASHVRNAFSASIQNWWKMGLGPWRADLYFDAHKEFKSNGKYLKEMKELGFSERTGYMAELMNNYLLNKELIGKSIKQQIGSKVGFVKYLKKLDRLMLNSYGHTDNIAKVAAYKFGRSKGLSKEEAYSQAMAATFNYSEITPFVHQMRRAIWGVPFITFALKAVPLTAETLVNNPNRISFFGKVRNDLFKAAGVDGEQEAEALPDYMRDDMFVMRIPWKDSEGRSMYFDMSYIIPFGAIADGSLLKDPIASNPVLQLIREVSRNETFSGNKIFKESDDIDSVIVDLTAHVLKLGLPPSATDFMSDGYKRDGTRAASKMGWERWAGINTQDLGPGERTYYQNLFRTLGMGATPYEINSRESAMAYTQQENLTKLLTENGVIKTFNSPYLPKDSELRPENQSSVPNLTDRDVKPLGR